MTSQLPKTLFQFILHFLKPHPIVMSVLIGFSIISGIYGTINSYLTKVLVTMYFINPAFGAIFLVWVVFFFSVSLFFSKKEMMLSDENAI